MMLGLSGLPGMGAKQKEMFMNNLKEVRQDASYQESLEQIPLETLKENYIEMKAKVIKEMEKCRNPLFLELLQYTQIHLTREEFLSIEVEVYAACNKAAMKKCSRDLEKIAHRVVVRNDRP